MRLATRRILVAGAASGIGKATARIFHEEGAAVGLLDRDSEGLAATRAEIEAAGGHEVAAAAADVVDEAAVKAGVGGLAGALGGLDGLVFTPAIDLLKPFGEVTAAEWRQVIDVNLTGAFHVASAALPHLRRAGAGSMVFVASGAGLRPLGGRTAYCASKAGLILFAKTLAVDLAADEIRVNTICPGIIETPLFRKWLNVAEDPEAELERVFDRYVIKRIGRPEDIAYAALYLTSTEAAHVTGSALAVDGGRCFH